MIAYSLRKLPFDEKSCKPLVALVQFSRDRLGCQILKHDDVN